MWLTTFNQAIKLEAPEVGMVLLMNTSLHFLAGVLFELNFQFLRTVSAASVVDTTPRK